MKKVSIIGLFRAGEDVANGQSVKTRIVTEELEKALGVENVQRIDTNNWKKNPLRLFTKAVLSVFNSHNVLFLTDEGGIRVFPWLLRWANIGKKCKIHYYVVGGWLSRYLDQSAKAVADLQKLDAIYVELPGMLKELEDRGFTNAVLLNKFRRLTPACAEELNLKPQKPYKLCYFSRVMREKGIEECIKAIILANENAGFEKYTLDVFGAINEDYKKSFDALMKDTPSYVQYKGVVDFQNSSCVLKDYFALLFPTYYASEGYPNAVVDAFAAGLPIIATRWHYNADIIQDNKDGILIDIGSVDQIVSAIETLSGDMKKYGSMRLNCLARCEEYLPEYAISTVIKKLK